MGTMNRTPSLCPPPLLVFRVDYVLEETLASFAEAGIECAGMAIGQTEIYPVKVPADVQGIIVTSSATLAALPGGLEVPLFCVGEGTARRAREKGFAVALAGPGNAEDLAKAILASSVKPCKLLHAAGESARQAWYTLLQEKGFHVEHTLAYRVVYVDEFEARMRDFLKEEEIKTLAVYSLAALRVVQKLLVKENLSPTRFNLLALHARIAAEAAEFATVTVAKTPSQAAMEKACKATNGEAV